MSSISIITLPCNGDSFLTRVSKKLTDKMKRIQIIEIERPNYITVKVTPCRNVDNRSNVIILNAAHELYKSFRKRVRFKKWRLVYKAEESVFFDITYSKDEIAFYITYPEEFDTMFQQKIHDAWQGSAIERYKVIPKLDYRYTKAYDLRYKRANIFSLRTDRDDNDPLNNQLGVVDYMKGDDRAQVSIEFIPHGRKDWMDVASDDYQLLKRGELPIRKDQILTNLPKWLLQQVDRGFRALFNEILTFTEGKEAETKPPTDAELQELLDKGQISNATRDKLSAPTFYTHISVFSESKDEERRDVNLRSIANSFKDITDNNELDTREVKHNILRIQIEYASDKIIPYKQHLKNQYIHHYGPNIMSNKEGAKLIQIPTAGLQDKFPQIDSIKMQEQKIPDVLLNPSKGIPFGYYTYKKVTKTVHIPINDHDELCLPHIVIAGMGQGKTRGFASNFMLEMFLKGFGSMGIDVAKGELITEVLNSVPPSMLNKVIILDFSNIDWPIALNWSEAITYNNRVAGDRMTAELCNFLLDKKDLDHFRTRKYLELAGKTVFKNPEATVLDILAVLTSPAYRRSLLDSIDDPEILRDWEDFDDMTPGMQRQIYDPILYRLNTMMGNRLLKNCLCQEAKYDEDRDPVIDFRKWMDEGYMVLVRAKKTDLGKQGVTDLVSFLTAKLWLATLTRPEDEELRPFFYLMDEPHQYLQGSVGHYEAMVTESRKWRLGLVYLFHSWAQLKKESREFVDILTSALPHYHVYSTSVDELKKMLDIIKPYTLEEAQKVQRHWAINVMRVKGEYHTFITRMLEPPSLRLPQYQNDGLRLVHSQHFGRNYVEVEKSIWDRQRILIKVDEAKPKKGRK